MLGFKINAFDKKKEIVDYSAKVEIDGDCYEASVRVIYFCDGACQYHIDARLLPISELDRKIVTSKIIELIENNLTKEEK
jgi:hypothetical protein